MTIAAIMPCRGRAAQTIENARRLLRAAGDVSWRLYLAGATPDVRPLAGQLDPTRVEVVTTATDRSSYWEALQALWYQAEGSHLVNLANDLWACDDWLALAVEEYQHHFAGGDGLLGFAGDGHGPGHSCHFLISRNLLERYGGWPTWYAHNFGDRELCARAQQDNLYAKSERAWLEHCHPERGLAQDDAIYQEGRTTYRQDEALFVERRRLGWPRVSR